MAIDKPVKEVEPVKPVEPVEPKEPVEEVVEESFKEVLISMPIKVVKSPPVLIFMLLSSAPSEPEETLFGAKSGKGAKGKGKKSVLKALLQTTARYASGLTFVHG